MNKEELIGYHNLILDQLLLYKKTHPEFTFWLRNKEKTDPAKNRLRHGYWFEGDDMKYIFVGLSKQSGGTNMTRSIGWVTTYKTNNLITIHLSVVWPQEKSQVRIDFYKKVINQLGGFVKKNDVTYHKVLGTATDEKSLVALLNHFLQNDYQTLKQLMQENPEAEMIIPESVFNDLLTKVITIKTEMQMGAGTSLNFNSKIKKDNNLKNMENINSLNTILYGPPGTGKTYSTIDNALQIVAPEEYQDTVLKFAADAIEQRREIVKLFNKYLVKSKSGDQLDWTTTRGKIAFCTFHQSFSYEDFIEGIKPNTDGKDISYTIQDGVFKLMCSLASKGNVSSSKIEIPTNARFTKLKVPTADDLQNCISNNVIGIKEGVSGPALAYFKTSLNTTNAKHVVLVTHDNVNVNAIGLVKSDAKADTNSHFKLVRDVDWISSNCIIPLSSIYDADINEDIIDALDERAVKKIIEEQLISKAQNDNHVLIIDEINRGNVSQIFGELITLIESDKRRDTDNELSVILPYSKQSFSVPKNLYLIGTMNTADRSVEALDTALRRRFDFIELPPVYSKLDGKKLKLNGKDFTKIKDVLETINERLKVLLTKDHQIGHSYFLKINSNISIQDVFKNNIIPLLQEYFYGDFAKICMVLGESFISKTTVKDNVLKKPFFAYSGHDATLDYEEKEIWTVNEEIFNASKEKEFAEALEKLLNPEVN